MRTSALILNLVATTFLMTPAGAQDAANLSGKEKEAVQKSTDKIQELQKERISALRTVVDLNTHLFQSSRGSMEPVMEAKVLLRKAELNAADKDSDRLPLYKNLVDVLTEYEEWAKQMKKSAQASEVLVLEVRARRLEAQIQLEQAIGTNPVLNREKIVVSSPQAKDLVVTQQFHCQLHSRRHIDVRSLQTGNLEEILVKDGQAVKQGDVMFKFATPLYKAKLVAALAEVKLAALDLKNAERLFQSKVLSPDEVARFQAKLAIAEAQAQLAEVELSQTLIRAPFDGVLGRLLQQEGSLITEQDVLTTLSDNSVMRAYFNVPQADYLKYQSSPDKYQEMKLELKLANGSKFAHSGKLAAIELQFDPQTQSIPFRADFPNPEDLLRHAMTGNVLSEQTLNNAIVIPQRATFELLGKRYVFVVDKQDIVHQREIVIAHELEDIFVIKQGVDANDKIVVEGVRQLRDGEKVEYELRKP